jgi:uncharacterized surface protein with fasciclin (FAS1) repeats
MKTIIDTITAAGNYKTLLAVLKTASFMDTLRTPGPYTLFAPTDEAFARLSPAQLKALLKDVRRLKTIVTYHVVSGTLAAQDVKPGELRSVEGSYLTVEVQAGHVLLNGARIVQGNIAASNGFIHAIDTLLVPKNVKLAAVA